MKHILAATVLTVAFLMTAGPVAAAASYLSFLAHEGPALIAGGSLITTTSDDLKAGSYSSSLDALNSLYAMSKSEVIWLNAHQPQSCYRTFWGTVRNLWTQLREAAATGHAAISDSDYAALDDYLGHIALATKYLNSANGQMKQKRCGY